MDDIIELRQLLKIITQKMWHIVFVTILLTLIASVGSTFLLKPQYEATTDLLLNSSLQVNGTAQQGTITQADITSNLMLIETYTTVIMSPRIMDPAAGKLGIPIDTLTKQVTIGNVKDSQVISIIAKDTDPNQAVLIANTVSSIFKEQITQLMKLDNVNVLTPAKIAKLVWPRPILTGAVAFIFGLLLSIGGVLFKEYVDTRLRTEEQVEKYLGLPVLGKVNVITKLAKVQCQNESPQVHVEPGGTEV